jgi:hypothetical protein
MSGQRLSIGRAKEKVIIIIIIISKGSRQIPRHMASLILFKKS